MLALRGSQGCKWLHIRLKNLHSPGPYLPLFSALALAMFFRHSVV